MNIATMITSLAGPALPDWRTSSKLKEPGLAVAAAQASIDDANRRIDQQAALVVSLDADILAAADLKQAARLEDLREKAVEAEAAARKDLARAERALAAARRIAAPLEQVAKRDAAKAVGEEHEKALRRVVADALRLKESAAALDVIHEHALSQFADETDQRLIGVAREFFKGLAASPLLAKVVGRRGSAIDQFVAHIRAVGVDGI